jgi:hypothetical protein
MKRNAEEAPTADQIQYALDLSKEHGKGYTKSKLEGMSRKEVSNAIDKMKELPRAPTEKQVNFALELIKEQGKSKPTKSELEKMDSEEVSQMIDKLKASGQSKLGMASTYVEITRDDFDDWMDSLRRRWKRKPGTEGIYVIPLSSNVGIQIRSSIGHKQMALDKGRASVTIKMVSLKNGKTLGKRGVVGQGKFYRTKDWRRRWAAAVAKIEKAYEADKDYYETTAVMDPEVYKVDTLKTIETVPGWNRNKMLRKWHDVVSRGGFLSIKQRSWLDDLASGKSKLRYANQIAKTIMEQMGGRRGMAMIGAKNLVSLPRGFAFMWPNRQRSKGNYVEITLTGRDDYDMEFFNVSMRGKKPVKKFRGIYADQLIPTFEGQTGWYLRMASTKTANPFLRSLDPDQERLAEELHLMAENDGAAYRKKDAKMAVKNAIRELRRSKIGDLDYDMKKVAPLVQKSLEARWRQADKDHRMNQRAASMKKAALVQEAMKRAKADPEFRRKLVAAVQKKAYGPSGGPIPKREYDAFFKHLLAAQKMASEWEMQDKMGGYVANEEMGAFMGKLHRDMRRHVK